MNYYTVCPTCGYKLLKADEGTNIEIYCLKCCEKMMIEVKEDKAIQIKISPKDKAKHYAAAGFRLAEGLSINPKTDIDYKRHIIKLSIPDQKTKKHQREVPYLPELLEGFDLTQSSLFPDITHNSARQYFSKLFKKHKIDAVIHSFRHTFISCCYHVGIPEKHIQKWAGHSSILMTMDTYTHILENSETSILDYLKRLKKVLKI